MDNIKIPRFAHGWVLGFAGSGVVTGANGIDKVPAMLSAGEVVLNAAQQGNVANALNRGSGGLTVIVQVEGNSFYWDDDEYFQKVGDKIVGNLRQHTGLNSF